MSDNPVLKRLQVHVGSGRHVLGMSIDSYVRPKKVTYRLEDGEEDELEVSPKDRVEFVKWWKKAWTWWVHDFERQDPDNPSHS